VACTRVARPLCAGVSFSLFSLSLRASSLSSLSLFVSRLSLLSGLRLCLMERHVTSCHVTSCVIYHVIYHITSCVISINQSNFTLNLKTATTSGGLQRRTKMCHISCHISFHIMSYHIIWPTSLSYGASLCTCVTSPLFARVSFSLFYLFFLDLSSRCSCVVLSFLSRVSLHLRDLSSRCWCFLVCFSIPCGVSFRLVVMCLCRI
jgi:hypothetical protein